MRRFHGKIEVFRHAEDDWHPEKRDIYAEYFEAKTIQSAKSKLTKIANETELFSWVQSWDNATRTYTGKDLRWKPWGSVCGYKQKDGTEVAYSTRKAERVSGEQIYPEGYGKYGKSVGYSVQITVYWKYQEGDGE
ncbi:MAG: hypothetical protein OXI63_02075 [Candidatus Poribacteria bacterium]|nr:hypothetical protein [Candidatus Poribacteria bacterium]